MKPLWTFRCVCCDKWAGWDEGGDDELELAFHQPKAGDDNGLCADCWVLIDPATPIIVARIAAAFRDH